MIFDNGNDINEKLLRQVPQFYGMTTDEIQTFIASMSRKEHSEWASTFNAKLAAERARCEEDVNKPEYKKEFDATDTVVIEECIKLTPDKIDEKGFVTTKVINNLERTVKLSREKIKNGQVYITPTKVQLAISTRPATANLRYWR